MAETLVRRDLFIPTSQVKIVDFLLSSCQFLHTADDIKRLIDGKRLLKNNQLVNSDELLQSGDELVLLTPQSLEPPVCEEIELLYEDDYLFAVTKPAHLPAHPSGKYYFNTLHSLIQRKLGLNASYPCSRLDRETSGIVLFAKSADVVTLLQKTSIQKWYYALVFGRLEGSGVIEKPLLQGSKGILRHHVLVDETGKLARTKYVSLAHTDEYSLLDVQLLTGKKHQIRVHFASLGYPLVGDKQYGAHPELLERYTKPPFVLSTPEILEKLGTSRHLLHCHKVEFIHPKTSKLISISHSIRGEFLQFLKEAHIDFF